MRYQHKGDSAHSVEENLRLETEAHDEEYDGRKPFGLDTLTFTTDQVWAINDHAYKRGTYRRGWRKRRLFQLMELDAIQGKRVLEIGCGQGHNAVFIAMYGAEVHGFDLSPKGIEMAQQIARANGVAGRCHFRVANVSAMPYENESFDIVLCNAVLHHIVKYPNVKEEIRRVLKPSGKLVFAEGVRDNGVYRLVRSLSKVGRPAHYHGDVDLEMADLRDLTAGYTAVRVEQFGLLEKFAQQAFGRDYDNGLAVRTVYRCTNVADRVLLTLMPFLRRQCLEVVGVATK